MKTVLVSIAIVLFIGRPAQLTSDGLIEEILKATLFPIYFYILSGYPLSCWYYRLANRPSRVLQQVVIIAAAFSVHTFAFFVAFFDHAFSDDEFQDFALKLYVFGLASVVFANTLGSLILARCVETRST